LSISVEFLKCFGRKLLSGAQVGQSDTVGPLGVAFAVPAAGRERERPRRRGTRPERAEAEDSPGFAVAPSPPAAAGPGNAACQSTKRVDRALPNTR
jgi:hypothetical protein